jgi:hypothetical protein
MSTNTDPTQKRPLVRVTLDGKAVHLAAPALGSLSSIRAQLELIALRQERVLTALRVDGVAVSLTHPNSSFQEIRAVEAVTISLTDYSRILLRRVQDHIHAMRRRLDAMVLLVMINEWPVIDWLWRGLQADFQVPLIKLGYLQEFYSSQSNCSPQALSNLRSHCQQSRAIWQRLGDVYALQDKLALSDALELDLLPWLMSLQHCLAGLDRCGQEG